MGSPSKCCGTQSHCVDPGGVMVGPAGWKVLIPCYPQWRWGQRERALVLFGSFAASLFVGLFAWGTPASWVILAFAFGTHVLSVADVIRQSAFPGFGRWVPVVSASAGLGMGCYGPMLALGLICAWPDFGGETGAEGYLINRGAYWSTPPVCGDWAWARLPGRPTPQPVRVLAGPGQQVEWSESGLRVEGKGVAWAPPPAAWRPRELALVVPPGQVLVALEPTAHGELPEATACGLALINQSQVGGRAWAKFAPLWERGLVQ
jgi:hypothetical protein